MTNDEKTPTRPGAPPVSGTAVELAGTAIALSTVATRLENAAELIRGSAQSCANAARLVDDLGGIDAVALLRDVEGQLGTLAEAVHDTRRAVTGVRKALPKGKPI